MARNRDSDEIIVRFLLGELPEAERDQIEERYFSDAEYFEQICAVENDLIDRYARGLLSTKEQEMFERGYLTTPARRKRVAFARSLARAAAQVQTADAREEERRTRPSSWWQSFIASLCGPGLVTQLSMAMALILLVGGVWAVLEISKLRRDLTTVSQERMAKTEREQELARQVRELETKIAEAGEERDDLAQQLEQLRQQQRELESRQDPSQGSPSVVAFVLDAGAERAGGDTPTLTIKRDIDFVRMQVNFDGGNYSSYKAQISTVKGTEIFSQGGIKARQSRNGAAISVKVPAQKLKGADYIMTLSGVSPQGVLEEVDKILFRVERK